MTDNKNLEALREEYSLASLNESDLNTDPFAQFGKWFVQAQESDLAEPNAMVLSTVNAKGAPSSRVMLLKSFDKNGFVFYTNYKSAKAQSMDVNPRVAACFLWKELQRQVRIEGTVHKMERSLSEKYFQSRPRGSQVGAWVSEQSQIIESREILEQKKDEILERFKDDELLPIPEHWGGYYIVPDSIEFWQGRKSRLHDRLCYQRIKDDWRIVRLSP